MFALWRFLCVGLSFLLAAQALAADQVVPRKPNTSVAPVRDLEIFSRAVANERGLAYPSVLALLQEARYNATVTRLINPAQSARKPARAWSEYRLRYVERIRIREGITFMKKHADALACAQARYGVPPYVIAALIGVESLYGRQTGKFRVLDTLATLAFHYPAPERADRVQMFHEQLADLIELHFTTHLNARTLQGSFAGAVGVPQFMPSSIKHYAVDGDGDGRIDLHHSIEDAVMSVGHFLLRHGWQANLPIFAPAQLPSDPAIFVSGGLQPSLTWHQLRVAGAQAPQSDSSAWQNLPLGMIDLPDAHTGRTEYRIATPNFFSLTHYNRSYFYAAAVADLALTLQQHSGDVVYPLNTPVDK